MPVTTGNPSKRSRTKSDRCPSAEASVKAQIKPIADAVTAAHLCNRINPTAISVDNSKNPKKTSEPSTACKRVHGSLLIRRTNTTLIKRLKINITTPKSLKIAPFMYAYTTRQKRSCRNKSHSFSHSDCELDSQPNSFSSVDSCK